MKQKQDALSTGRAEKVDQNSKFTGSSVLKEDTVGVRPEISEFFLNTGLRPGTFLQAVKKKKIKRFTKADQKRAVVALEEDVSGGRLWELMKRPNLPEPVARWISVSIQDRLRSKMGQGFNPLDLNPTANIKCLRGFVNGRLSAKDPGEVKVAENWLRIGLSWLIRKWPNNIWLIGESISPELIDGVAKAKSQVRRVMSTGTIKELRLISAVIILGEEIITDLQKKASSEKSTSMRLDIELSGAKRKVDALESELSQTQSNLAGKDDALKQARSQHQDDQQHWGHEMSEIKARQRTLLVEKIKPLLNDAVDALEIESPAPSIALNRIKSVLKEIDHPS